MDFECDGGLIAGTLDSSAGRSRGAGISPANITAACFGGNNTRGSRNVATALNASSGRLDFESETFVVGTLTHSGKAAGSATQQDAQCGLLVASALRAGGFDASEDGTGRETCVMAFMAGQGAKARSVAASKTLAPTLRSNGGGMNTVPSLLQKSAVRRLTPKECERLQGFPDGYTAVPWRGRAAGECPDGPRYRALGNSMAVPVMRWIGERIQKTGAA